MTPARGRAQGNPAQFSRPCYPGLMSLPVYLLRVRRSSSDDAHGSFVARAAHMHAEAPLRRGCLLFLRTCQGPAASQGSTLRLARGIRWFGRLLRGCYLPLGSAADLRLRASFAYDGVVVRRFAITRSQDAAEKRGPDSPTQGRRSVVTRSLDIGLRTEPCSSGSPPAPGS